MTPPSDDMRNGATSSLTHPPSHALFGDARPYPTNAIIDINVWMGIVLRTERDIALGSRVTRVEYRKYTAQQKHEFLLLNVVWPPSGATVVLRIDRRQLSQGLEEASMISSSKDVDATDQVVQRPKGLEMRKEGPAEILRYVDFPSQEEPNVLWTTYLIRSVRQRIGKYNLLGGQCYVFTQLIYHSLLRPRDQDPFVKKIRNELDKPSSWSNGQVDHTLKAQLLSDLSRWLGRGEETLNSGATKAGHCHWSFPLAPQSTAEDMLPGIIGCAAIAYEQDSTGKQVTNGPRNIGALAENAEMLGEQELGKAVAESLHLP